MDNQFPLFDTAPSKPDGPRLYLPVLTVAMNSKGVLDIDTVKGCAAGMRAYPGTGCYGECYAAKIAARYGIDFTKSVSRQFMDREHRDTLVRHIQKFPAKWYRVGVAGDPCHDWKHTIAVLRSLRWTGKTPVIITKHWTALTDKQVGDLKWLGAVIGTSTSGLDTDAEMAHRVKQIDRLRAAGVQSVCWVITCEYGTSEWAQAAKKKQDYLLTLSPVIDCPLRASASNPRVLSGDILLTERPDAIGGGKLISLHDSSTYLGTCAGCPDQCGVTAEISEANRTKFGSFQGNFLEGANGSTGTL